ncbi:uncharacterized protein LOC115748064 isoform X2 [Rhodamnia argentea]|uniref:Uncharacterized protein LOC115748064 isoform X2 n=1 Tax=Rhodamnia argentea TaxID=178133 RepID=A0A8B8Q197_9MYRT|nr:uncharacterized protein LOC115748064 isoform X2 [Rhodamnia argentea]
MEALKKWSVTFTKHLKQKRKVYCDGFLSLHTSTGKVMLYDDSEQLLECRILKNDEVVSSGETLAFNAYLVDVGEPEEGQRPLDDTCIRSRENRVPKGRASLHRNKFVKVSDCADEKTKVEKDKQQTISLSPSQKIIREFKKNEMNKYGMLQASPNSRTSSMADWHVLYTTQLTQKSKKYHDGFLRCTSSGPMTRQVFLYDTSWKLLDSMFLNKAEEVSPGEMMVFPGHLVEVGNREAKSESLRDLNACGNSFSSFHKLNMQKQQHNVTTVNSAVKEEKNGQMHQNGAKGSILDAGKSSVTEWQVLYTTQVTQKAKKYHDGFLQLEVRGSLGRQVTLYDAGRKVLVNKFLRKDEVLGTGKSLVFDSHLVDIGEHVVKEKVPIGLNDREPCFRAGEMRTGHKEVDGAKVDQSILGVLWLKHGDKTSGKIHPARDSDSDSGKFGMKSTDCIRRVPETKPLRDASQILSVLRKPLHEVAVAENSYERKATFASLTKDLQHSDNSSDSAQRQRAPAAKLASLENVDTGNLTYTTGNGKLPGLMKSKDSASDFNEFHSMVGFGIGNSQPSHEQADPCCGNNLASEASLSRGSHGDANGERMTPDGDRNPMKAKVGCPSFDLGF